MPEQDFEKPKIEGQISGEVSNPADDEALKVQIELLRHELSSLPKPQVIVDVDDGPVSVNKTQLIENDPVRKIASPSLVQGVNSPIQIFEVRQQIRIASETGDLESLRQLKKAA